jgi:hypothetical protein
MARRTVKQARLASRPRSRLNVPLCIISLLGNPGLAAASERPLSALNSRASPSCRCQLQQSFFGSRESSGISSRSREMPASHIGTAPSPGSVPAGLTRAIAAFGGDEPEDNPDAIAIDLTKELRLGTVLGRILKMLATYGPMDVGRLSAAMGLSRKAIGASALTLFNGRLIGVEHNEYALEVELPAV